jgi:hypothetical protein
VFDDAGGEGFAGSGAVTGGVEGVGGLGVGVVFEELVEAGEGVGVGPGRLPAVGWDGESEAGGRAAAEADVQADLVGLVDGDVVYEEAGYALALPLGGGGVGPQGGEVGGEGANGRLLLTAERFFGCARGPLVVVSGVTS